MLQVTECVFDFFRFRGKDDDRLKSFVCFGFLENRNKIVQMTYFTFKAVFISQKINQREWMVVRHFSHCGTSIFYNEDFLGKGYFTSLE